MSDLREIKLPTHQPPAAALAASDGSPLTVMRDAQGQIREVSGTGRDGVVRRVTMTSKIATNPAGFHFIATQLHFFENGVEYLQLRTLLSPDAGKGSFQAFSGTSQFGFAIGISPAQGQATVVTTTGARVTVDLSTISLLSPHTLVSPSSLPGLLTPPEAVQKALSKAEYFQPVFEQENRRYTADLEAALQAVNLSASMPAKLVLSRLLDIQSTEMSKPEKTVSKAFGWGYAAALTALLGLGVAVATGTVVPIGLAALLVLDSGLLGAAAALWDDRVSSLPEPPSIPAGNDTPPDDIYREAITLPQIINTPPDTTPPSIVLPEPVPGNSDTPSDVNPPEPMPGPPPGPVPGFPWIEIQGAGLTPEGGEMPGDGHLADEVAAAIAGSKGSGLAGDANLAGEVAPAFDGTVILPGNSDIIPDVPSDGSGHPGIGGGSGESGSSEGGSGESPGSGTAGEGSSGTAGEGSSGTAGEGGMGGSGEGGSGMGGSGGSSGNSGGDSGSSGGDSGNSGGDSGSSGDGSEGGGGEGGGGGESAHKVMPRPKG